MGNKLGERVAQRAQQTKAATAEVAVQGAGAVEAAQPQTVAQYIRSMEKQFEAAMPKGAEATQLVRDALTALRTTKNLDLCDHLSVLGALMTCAQLGLRPNVPSLGHAWLLPFRKRVQDEHGNWGNGPWYCQLIMGYQGYRELAQRSGQIASVVGRVVYENDFYDVELGLDEKLVHKPFRGGPRGEATDYYAIVRYINGGYSFWPMSRLEVEDHRDKYAMARTYDKTLKRKVIVGPWVDNFDEMAVKTAFLRLSKWMPKTPELAAAIAADGTVRVDLTPNLDAIHHAERPDPSAAALDGGEEQAALDGEIVDGEVVGHSAPQQADSHTEGHGKAMAWDPECVDCQGDKAGQQHHETHNADEPSCEYCQREVRWMNNNTGDASGAKR
jgi:recombination protein RecT